MVLIWSNLWLNQVTLQSIFCLLWKASNNEMPVNLVFPFSGFNLLQIVQIWRENWWICFYSVVYIAKPFSDYWPDHYVTQCFFFLWENCISRWTILQKALLCFPIEFVWILISKKCKEVLAWIQTSTRQTYTIHLHSGEVCDFKNYFVFFN